MSRWNDTRRRALRGLGVAVMLALGPISGSAQVGEYSVSTCFTNSGRFGTEAAREFASSGMRTVNTCDMDPGGLSTGNEPRMGSVARGARADAVLEAPAGTRIVGVKWTGEARRVDCRYALQVWGEAPETPLSPIFNVRANDGCPRRGHVQAARLTRKDVPLTGATRIVQRVTCVAGEGRRSCSASGSNFVRTVRLELVLEDGVAPSASISSSTALARGEWVSGPQRLDYDAADNVGVMTATASIGGAATGFADRGCALAPTGVSVFARVAPCPIGGGRIETDTTRAPEGTQSLAVVVSDLAGNSAAAAPTVARVDNTAPERVAVVVTGGDGWRSRSDVGVSWANPAEADRAPIVAATYKLCPIAGGECREGEQAGDGVSRLVVVVPSPGQWSVSLWLRDAAGNQSALSASAPVTVGYDPDPPHVAFEPRSPGVPALVAANTSDAISGVVDSGIEISRTGDDTWRELPVERSGDRLTARIDDVALAAGAYRLRTRAVDLAGNETVTELGPDGQPMVVSLPLRIVSKMETGFERERTVRQTVRRNGRSREVHRRVTVQSPTARVLFGASAVISGRLVSADGNGIASAEVQVFATSTLGPEQPVGVIQSDAEGRYRYVVQGSTNQSLRFAYAGSGLVLPAESRLTMTVPAATALRVDHQRLRNGQTVTFSGPVQTLPTPPGGKLVEMQVRLPGRWETFRTVRGDEAGQWSVRYRFRNTSGVQYYRFRARLPAEGAYAFAGGVSRVVSVRVTGS